MIMIEFVFRIEFIIAILITGYLPRTKKHIALILLKLAHTGTLFSSDDNPIFYQIRFHISETNLNE